LDEEVAKEKDRAVVGHEAKKKAVWTTIAYVIHSYSSLYESVCIVSNIIKPLETYYSTDIYR
jgi:hypothetical protein